MLDFLKCKCPKMPWVRKCCFCVPIRTGVAVLGYANLVFYLLSLPILIFVLVDTLSSSRPPIDEDPPRERIFSEITNLFLIIFFMFLDVILTIILLIGIHKKKKLLLQVSFYAGVAFQLITFTTDFLYYDDYDVTILYLSFLFINVYQLFLIYNIIAKLAEEDKGVQYVVYQEERRRMITNP